MKILVILGHPNPESFNHAIAALVCQTLKQLGHSVTLHDLCAEDFNPLMSREEIDDDAIPAELMQHCDELASADGIVVIHPNWRDQPPAIVKGWIDRVFRSGVAFGYEGEQGELELPVGLLTAECALIFTTSDCPSLKDDPLERLWKESIFGACGVKTITRRNFGEVILSNDAARKSWLNDVVRITQEVFPAS